MRERAALIVALTLAVAAFPVRAGEVGPAVSPERAAELERLVRQDCGSCHGMTLKGGLGSDITAAALAGTPPEALTSIILDGIPGTPMPPWRPVLTEGEAQWIADYLLEAE